MAKSKTTKSKSKSKTAAANKAKVKKTAVAKKTTVKKTKKSATISKTNAKKKSPMKKNEKKKQETIKKTRKKVSAKQAPPTPAVIEPSPAELREKALKKIKGYSKKDLEHFKQIILEKRDEIIEQLQNLKEQMLDPTTGEYINENSPYSLHMAEQGTDAMEREKTFLYAQRENKFLGYLEEALNRIENGTYGICIECIIEPQHLCETCPLIPKARLEAVPHSQHCLPIKQRQEKAIK